MTFLGPMVYGIVVATWKIWMVGDHFYTLWLFITNGFGPPWTPERFAQLDHIVCPRRWRNSILNVESRTDIAFDSDHAILAAHLRIKLGTERRTSTRKIERYRTPDHSQKVYFDNSMRSMFRYTASQVCTQTVQVVPTR